MDHMMIKWISTALVLTGILLTNLNIWSRDQTPAQNQKFPQQTENQKTPLQNACKQTSAHFEHHLAVSDAAHHQSY